jgi:hypothetical protein
MPPHDHFASIGDFSCDLIMCKTGGDHRLLDIDIKGLYEYAADRVTRI